MGLEHYMQPSLYWNSSIIFLFNFCKSSKLHVKFYKIQYIYYLAIKKEQNNAICSNVDGTRDSHTKWNKSERERQIPYDITYLESNILHKRTFPQTRNLLILELSSRDLFLIMHTRIIRIIKLLFQFDNKITTNNYNCNR